MEGLTIYSTVIDEKGEIISCNNPLRKKLGFHSSPNLIGKSIFEVFRAWELDKIEQAISSCKANPELIISIHVRHTASKEKESLYEWTISSETDEKGKSTIHLSGKSNNGSRTAYPGSGLFEQFMKHSPIVGWITDEDGIMYYMNPVYLTSYGFSTQDIGKTLFELFPKEIAEDYVKNNCIVLRQNQSIETIEKAILPGGKQQVLKIFKFPLQVDGKQMVAGWAVDITDQMALQDELAKNLERFYYVKRATSDAIYDWDVKRKIVYRGIGFQTLFGHPGLRGSIRFNFHYVHPLDLEKVKQTVFASLRDPSIDRWKMEYRFCDVNGEYKYVVDKAFIIREEDQAVRVIGAMQDITEQRLLQERLVLQEKNNRIKVVRSIIEAQEKERKQLSLELHDNVNQILSSCKLLLDVAKSNREMAPSLTEKASIHLQTAITEIRKISHDLNPAAVQDIGLVEAVHQMVADINEMGRIQIKFVQEGCLKKECLKEEDRISVFRIIQEKLTNILKHSQAKNAVIKLSLKKNRLHLVMSDDGIGFDVSKVKKGIGIKNIQNRVDYYQGTMKLKASPGKGCSMEIKMHMEDQC
ncbi:MAG TPA: PAS domain S-box protein [Flavisolibacter sp.]|nr:PAS domain S-box protein [Flavisolibacter sp.]